LEENEFIQKAIRMDLIAIKERDPACPGYAHALLYMKGFHGVTC
jgi:serine O-acetyltransferase